jgi:hypothetical protein
MTGVERVFTFPEALDSMMKHGEEFAECDPSGRLYRFNNGTLQLKIFDCHVWTECMFPIAHLISNKFTVVKKPKVAEFETEVKLMKFGMDHGVVGSPTKRTCAYHGVLMHEKLNQFKGKVRVRVEEVL